MEKTKVYQAIVAVQEELSKVGIKKDKRNNEQNYKFRGIDDIYDAMAPALAKNKLCIIPQIISRVENMRDTKAGGKLYHVLVEIEYSFICCEDGSKHITKIFGEAIDSADKATNKAMSAAYKYLAMQTFCIPVDVQDADASTGEDNATNGDAKKQKEPPWAGFNKKPAQEETKTAATGKNPKPDQPKAEGVAAAPKAEAGQAPAATTAQPESVSQKTTKATTDSKDDGKIKKSQIKAIITLSKEQGTEIKEEAFADWTFERAAEMIKKLNAAKKGAAK